MVSSSTWELSSGPWCSPGVSGQQRTAEEISTGSDGVPFDFVAETDPRVLEQLRTVRDYDAILVDCPGNLEDTETLVGVLASASFALIPMIPEGAAVQPTLRTARLCPDHKVPHRVVVNMADPLRGAGPVESAWQLLDDLEVPRMVLFVRRYVGHSQAQLDGRMITEYRGDRSAAAVLADVRRVQARAGAALMAGQRKTVGSLVGAPDTAPLSRATSPDSPSKDDRPAKPAPGRAAYCSGRYDHAQLVHAEGLGRRARRPGRRCPLRDPPAEAPDHGRAVNVLQRHRAEIEAEARAAAGNGNQQAA
jgi:chromosome partitioning protein